MTEIDGRTFAHVSELKVGDTVRGAFVENGKLLPMPLDYTPETYRVAGIVVRQDGYTELHGGKALALWTPGATTRIELVKRGI